MLELTRSVIKDICTVKNGQDYDMAGVFGLLGVLFACGMAAYSLATTDPKNITPTSVGEFLKDFGLCLAAIIAAACGGKAWKKDAEPE